jgi:YVTN family beta-propeller protein
VVSAESSVTEEVPLVGKSRAASLPVTLAVLVVLICLPGCFVTPKPPTPTLTGPDTGWTHTPTVFTETDPGTGGWHALLCVDWGDGAGAQGVYEPTHEYSQPGIYVVRCRLSIMPRMENWQFGSVENGDWSSPCTVCVVAETLLHPDSVLRSIGFRRRTSWCCALPNGIAVYVTCGADSSVYVLDPGTNAVTKRIQVQSDPCCCVTSADGDVVYVANRGSNSISAIRTSDNSVVDTIPLPAAPTEMALLPNDTYLYVTHAAQNRVSVVRLSDDSIVARIAVRDSPTGIACTPDGQHVYVGGLGNDTVTLISALDNTVERTFGVGRRPTSAVFSPGGETVYVACEGAGHVEMYRCSDLTEIDSAGPESYPRYLLMLPGNQCLYLVSSEGHIRILRRYDNFALKQLYLDTAGGPSVLPDGSRLYVPNGNVVTVLGPSPK